MKKEYICEKNSLYNCNYFVSFCTIYKRKIIDTNELKLFLENDFNKIAKEYNFSINKIQIKDNQVLMEVSCSPKLGIDTVITKLKDISAKNLKEAYPSFTKRVPCIWTRNSFIETIGTHDETYLEKFVSLQQKYKIKGE